MRLGTYGPGIYSGSPGNWPAMRTHFNSDLPWVLAAPQQVPDQSIRGLGNLNGAPLGVVGCGPLDTLLGQMQAALAIADKAGVNTSDTAYIQVKAFIDSQDYLYNPWGSACTDAVAAGTPLLTALNASIQAAGGSPVTVPSAPTSVVGSVLTTVQLVAIAVGIGALAYFSAPIVKALVKK